MTEAKKHMPWPRARPRPDRRQGPGPCSSGVSPNDAANPVFRRLADLGRAGPSPCSVSLHGLPTSSGLVRQPGVKSGASAGRSQTAAVPRFPKEPHGAPTRICHRAAMGRKCIL